MTDRNSTEQKEFAERASLPARQVFLAKVITGTLAQKLLLDGVNVADQLEACRLAFESYPFITLAPDFYDQLSLAAQGGAEAVEQLNIVFESGHITIKAA
jgi:hypothetical protein